MIVTPQSNLQIMRGIPWTSDYKHTRYFSGGLADQNNYMQTHVVASFSDFTYVREQNIVRVPMLADSLYNCNYLRYMNSGFGSKWFYAFITDIKYVNPEATEISFEIDYFQTWWFNVQMGHCYVEREHVADDTIGKHIIDEGIGTGDIVPQVVQNRFWEYKNPPTPDTRTPQEKGLSMFMQVKPTLIGHFCANQSPFNFYDNQIVPRTVEKPAPVDVADLKSDLVDASFTGAEVNDAYMFPYEIQISPTAIFIDMSEQDIKRPTNFKYSLSVSGDQDLRYTPKNNKLLTYPYTYLLVTSSDGNKKTYKWENTREGKVTFDLDGCAYNVPSCSLMPNNYVGGAKERLDDIPINNFPKITLGTYDSFNIGNLANGALKLTGDILTGNVMGGLTDVVNGVTGLATDTTDKDFATAGNSTLIKKNMIGYTFYVMCIYGQNAKVIDDYLTRFGYKVNEIKLPELHSRKRWNYVKTKECEIHARDGQGAPTEALQRIQDMFNAGVTLWHVDSVGDFNGDNGIRS